MGKRVQAPEEVNARDIPTERADYRDVRANKPGRRPTPRVGETNAAEVHQDVLKHFFPNFVIWSKEVRDTQKKNQRMHLPY